MRRQAPSLNTKVSIKARSVSMPPSQGPARLLVAGQVIVHMVPKSDGACINPAWGFTERVRRPPAGAARGLSADDQWSKMEPRRALSGALAAALMLLVVASGACRRAERTAPRPKPAYAPFNFQIEVGADHYSIEGFIAHAPEPGRLP